MSSCMGGSNLANLRRKHYKVVMIGGSSAGKSSIALRFTKDLFFDYSESTIGASFLSANLDDENKNITLDIWDTAGQERYHSLAPMYYRGANAVIIVYDITSKESFDKAKCWYEEIRIKVHDVYIILVGNKIDLNTIRTVSISDGENYAKSKNIDFIECSAKTNNNIEPIFRMIAVNLPEESYRETSHKDLQASLINLNNSIVTSNNEKCKC